MLKAEPQHTYVLLEKDPDESPFRNHPSVEHVKADVHWYGIAEQIRMPSIIRQTKADLLFVPHWNVTWSSPIPRVVFIHDLILLEEPKSANITTRGPLVVWIKRIGFRMILKRALYESNQIHVPLEYTREWIKKHFPDLKTPITVTGEGMPEVDQSMWQEPDLEHPYFMTVGSAYPHKNHEMLFEAWKEVAVNHPEVRLLVVGKKDAFMQSLMDQCAGHRAQGAVSLLETDINQDESPCPAPRAPRPNIEFLGEVSDHDLKQLYSKALALVFPSRWEGFGLPPLEALAVGCPVLSSDSSCMPEVLGPVRPMAENEGIIYFNPSRPDAIVRAIEIVLNDPSGVRGKARRNVPFFKEKYDWHKAASRTLRAFEEVLRVP
jgi:glycosyltransferase involved in cell wall biosynthesis